MPRNAEGFSVIKVIAIPKCDVCGFEHKGIYDGPINRGGPWANMCQGCFDTLPQESKDCIKNMGSLRVLAQRTITKINRDPNEVVVGKELTDPMDIVMDAMNREIECPRCGEIRAVEPDADYAFKCEGCGVLVKCKALI